MSTNNSTQCSIYNDYDTLHLFKFPVYLGAAMKINSYLIILLNGFVLVCLIAKRRLFSGNYWYQMVCLSVNDIITGVGVWMQTLLEYEYVNTDVVLCSFAHALNIIAQIATLLNILGICIQRFIIMKNANRIQAPPKPWHTLVQMILSWVTSTVYCMLPFVFWTNTRCPLRACALETLFEENFDKAVVFWIVGLSIPLILTNSMYLVLFVLIRRLWNRVGPHPDISNTTVTEQAYASGNHAGSLPGTSNDRVCDHNLPGTSEERIITLKNLEPKLNLSKSSAYLSSINSGVRQGKETSKATRPTRHKQLEKKSFALIGIILLLFNVVTWPSAIISICVLIPSVNVSYSCKVAILATITLNSLINPFVYTLRIPEFRQAVQDLFRSCAQIRLPRRINLF